MLFISTIESLSKLVASNSKDPILVGGDLVLLSHDKTAAADIGALTDRYVSQPPRMASRKSLFDKGKKNLYVSIDKQAVEMILAYKGSVALSADQYLAYGLSQKKNVIVIGGGWIDKELSLEGFVFTDQSLVDTFEKITPLSGYMLDVALQDIVSKYPDHYIHWCSPLEPMPDCDIKSSLLFVDAGDEAIKHLIKRKIFSRRQSEEEGWGLIPAIAVGFAGFAVFAAATGWQWSQLEKERAEYQSEIQGYEAAYEKSAHSLELLRHRDFLLSSESEALAKTAMLDNLIVKVASVDNILIHSIKVVDLDDVDTSDGSMLGEMFVLDISIPKEPGNGARKQAERLVKNINRQLGMSVRVASHTSFSHRFGEEDKEYWRYTLGGGI